MTRVLRDTEIGSLPIAVHESKDETSLSLEYNLLSLKSSMFWKTVTNGTGLREDPK